MSSRESRREGTMMADVLRVLDPVLKTWLYVERERLSMSNWYKVVGPCLEPMRASPMFLFSFCPVLFPGHRIDDRRIPCLNLSRRPPLCERGRLCTLNW